MPAVSNSSKEILFRIRATCVSVCLFGSPRQTPRRIPTGKCIVRFVPRRLTAFTPNSNIGFADDISFSGIVELDQLLLHFSDHKKKDQCQLPHKSSTTNNTINRQDEGPSIILIHCCIVDIHTAALRSTHARIFHFVAVTLSRRAIADIETWRFVQPFFLLCFGGDYNEEAEGFRSKDDQTPTRRR